MEEAINLVAKYSTHIITLATLIILIAGSVILQFIEPHLLFFQNLFYTTILLVLLELLGLGITINKNLQKSLNPCGIVYLKQANPPDQEELVARTNASKIYLCVSNFGRTSKILTDLLKIKNLEVNLFFSSPEYPLLPKTAIEEGQVTIRKFFEEYQVNPHYHFYTLKNPPSIGFEAFCDKNDDVILGIMHWYTFQDGFRILKGRGRNGMITVKRGVSPDADLLLAWLRQEIQYKQEDTSKREIHSIGDIWG